MGTIEDHRSEDEKARTAGFVVATDSFMSGWGPCSNGGRSLYAVPFETDEQRVVVLDNFAHRSEMKRVRVVGSDYWPTLGPNDHLSIAEMNDCPFYRPDWFAAQERERAARR